MNSFVLDASALLALLNEEPGQNVVEEVIGDCSISAPNYCEVDFKPLLFLPPAFAFRTAVAA